MKTHRRTIDVDDLDCPIPIHSTGDWHLLARQCARGLLKRNLHYAAEDPAALFFLLGDLADMVTYRDKRFDPGAYDPALRIEELGDLGPAAVNMILDVAGPLKGRVIWSVGGNHEGYYSASNNCRIHQTFADALDAPCSGFSALIWLTFKERVTGRTKSFSVFLAHGSGNAETVGGKLNRLIRTMQINPEVDLVLMGHVHEQLTYTQCGVKQTASGIKATTKDGVICGTYLKTYEEDSCGYGERKLYLPTALGHPIVHVTPSSKRITVEWLREAPC